MAAVTPRPIDPKPKPIDPNPAVVAKRRRQFQQFADRVRQGVRGAGKPPPRGAPLTRMPIPLGGASRGRITEDDPRWKASTMGNKTGWEKGTWFTAGKPQVNRNTSAETGKKSANWGEKYGVGVDHKGREIHVYADGRTVQAHSDAFYKANPDALKPPPAPNPAKGKTMPRKPPPVAGAANRKGLLAQFNQRMKVAPGRRFPKPKVAGRHGPKGFRGFKPPPRGDLPRDPTYKRL